MSLLRSFYPRALFWLFLCLAWCSNASAQVPSRITGSINDDVATRLRNTAPLVPKKAIDLGSMDEHSDLGTMMLVFNSSEAQKEALDLLIAQQQDKMSALYHGWISSQEFGRLFGISESDLARITAWLESHGLTVVQQARGHRSITFRGNVNEIESTFHTEMHRYLIDGEEHYSNSTDISVPSAIKDMVVGIASLSNIPPTALHNQGLQHLVGPGDFAVIYNTLPLLQAGKDGNQQTIGIIGFTDVIQQNDPQLQRFRQLFLPSYNANDTNVIPATTSGCNDPYYGTAPYQLEAYADLEWAGAVAPRSTLAYVPTADMACGADYLIQNNIPSVISVSYGSCEANLGAYTRIMANLWQQAAAQGITVFVAAGDSGAAGCDSPTEQLATQGYAVNGYASTPYNVAVGGTQFNDNLLTWNLTDRTLSGVNLTWTSARGYIPEVVWNDTQTDMPPDLYAGGGGVSTCYAIPAWQNAPGVPSFDPIQVTTLAGCAVASQHRYLPDISLSAAKHDAYVVCNVAPVSRRLAGCARS